ncbi:MAG: hypothetical protein RL637_521 [Pseudomonadota bacterium]|jgi:ABC-type uncharacterized transport system involved in gliding motility auxiliary subunit
MFLMRYLPAIKYHLVTTLWIIMLLSLGWFSQQHQREIDLTATRSNTLSDTSRKVLQHLTEPIKITVFLKASHPSHKLIYLLLKRYQKLKPDIQIQFIDPEQQLELTKEYVIPSQGLTVVEYQGRQEQIAFLDESSLTNGLLQLAHSKEQWISFLTGHGERSPVGIANFDLGNFGKLLTKHGFKVAELNLVEVGGIPDNSAVLVIAAPRVPLLNNEIKLIQKYIQQGGNLLLLTDPEDQFINDIEKQLGIHKLKGTIIEEQGKLYGNDNPTFIVIGQYLRHPITQSMQNLTVYPAVAALEKTSKQNDFQVSELFKTHSQAWTEISEVKHDLHFDPKLGEKQQILTLAMALTRNVNAKISQRIVVVGDGDFLSNSFVGYVGNQELGLRIFNWLTHDDEFVNIPFTTSTGKQLKLTTTAVGVIGFGFLVIVPLILTVVGIMINYYRKW